MQEGPCFFAACGVLTGDDGLWLRKQYIILAKNNNTDVSFWQSQPLTALRSWIKANNAVIDDAREEANGK